MYCRISQILPHMIYDSIEQFKKTISCKIKIILFANLKKSNDCAK